MEIVSEWKIFCFKLNKITSQTNKILYQNATMRKMKNLNTYKKPNKRLILMKLGLNRLDA